jgi:hypothetical protein
MCSWAIWDEVGEKPKSNMGNMDILDPELNPNLLNIIHTDIVMIGLNISRDVDFDKPFRNFHDPSPSANDFKIRYAFQDTYFYGAYMTDLIKNTIIKSSKELIAYLRADKLILHENIMKFQVELEDIKAHKPIILAFGREAFELLEKNLPKSKYSELIKITHYSHFISKEDYKKQSIKQISKHRIASSRISFSSSP